MLASSDIRGRFVEVSMLALFRLACASFLFGGVLYLALRSIALFLHAFSCGGAHLSPRLCRYLPKGWEKFALKKEHRPRGKVRRFFLDFLLCVICGLSFILFLFWQADGIPRLFVFCAAGGGAYTAKRLFSVLFLPIVTALAAVLSFVWLWFSVPLARATVFLGRNLFAFLKKIVLFFIKRGKWLYTIYKAKKYAKTAEKQLKDTKLSSKIREAIFLKEET